MQGAGFIIHIVAVEVHAGFHAQGVARAEAARLHACRLQSLEKGVSFGGGQNHFHAVFAGVAGAGNKPVVAQIGALKRFELVHSICPFGFDAEQFFNGFGALHGQHGQIVARGDFDAESFAHFGKLSQIFGAGGGIGHNAVGGFFFIGAIHNQVVHHAAVVVEHGGIEGFADKREFGHIVGKQLLQPGFGLSAGDVGNQHVRHVKHAGIGAHGFVFGDLRTVVDRQHPAGEIHQLAAGFLVGLIKRGGLGVVHFSMLRSNQNRLGGVLGTRPYLSCDLRFSAAFSDGLFPFGGRSRAALQMLC